MVLEHKKIRSGSPPVVAIWKGAKLERRLPGGAPLRLPAGTRIVWLLNPRTDFFQLVQQNFPLATGGPGLLDGTAAGRRIAPAGRVRIGLVDPMPARPAHPSHAAPRARVERADCARYSGAVRILLLGLFSREIYDSDFWWHLRTGQYIVEQRALPFPDPFAWTTAGARDAYPGEARTRRFNLTHEWLAQVVFYAVWRVGGMRGEWWRPGRSR